MAHLRSRAVNSCKNSNKGRKSCVFKLNIDASGKPRREKHFPWTFLLDRIQLNAQMLDESTVKFPRSWEPEKPFFPSKDCDCARSICERFKTFHLEIGYAGCHLWSFQSCYIKRPLCFASGGVKTLKLCKSLARESVRQSEREKMHKSLLKTAFMSWKWFFSAAASAFNLPEWCLCCFWGGNDNKVSLRVMKSSLGYVKKWKRHLVAIVSIRYGKRSTENRLKFSHLHHSSPRREKIKQRHV